MHIEINGGGIASFGTMNDLQDQLNVLIGDSADILSAFKTVESKTVSLNGGIGNLRDAVEDIGRRIQKEEQKLEHAKEALTKTVEFTANTISTDGRVAEIVKNNQEDFYRMHPWLRPPVPEKDKNMFEQAWEHVKEGFREFGEAFKDLFEGIKDTLKKGWDALVEFYEENKELIHKILKTIGLITAAVIAVVGLVVGGPLVLVPLLTALGISASTAAAISGAIVVIAIVSKIGSTGLDITDTWMEIDNPVFNTIQKIFSITSRVTSAMVSLGSIYNKLHPDALKTAKDQLTTHYETRSGQGSYGQKVEYVSDYVPGSDNGVSRINIDQHGEFYHVKTSGGADIHISTGSIGQPDFAPIVDNAPGHVNIITGVHGGIDGEIAPHFKFYLEDIRRWETCLNVKVYDITTMTLPELRNVLFEKGTNICAWCYSERSKAVLTALNLLN